MIKAMELRNFKCFHRQQIAFRPLTLLTGVNSAGKSTVIQALLLLRQNLALYRGDAEWCGLSKLSNAYEEKSLQLVYLRMYCTVMPMMILSRSESSRIEQIFL